MLMLFQLSVWILPYTNQWTTTKNIRKKQIKKERKTFKTMENYHTGDMSTCVAGMPVWVDVHKTWTNPGACMWFWPAVNQISSLLTGRLAEVKDPVTIWLIGQSDGAESNCSADITQVCCVNARRGCVVEVSSSEQKQPIKIVSAHYANNLCALK